MRCPLATSTHFCYNKIKYDLQPPTAIAQRKEFDMKTCPACHTDITDDTSRFCPNCGAPLRITDNPYATPSVTDTTGDDLGKTTPAGNGFARPGSTGTESGGFGRTGSGSAGSGFGHTGPGSYTPPSSYNTGYTGYTYQPPVAQPSGGLAIAALICSFFLGIVGLILGIVGLNQYPKGNGYRTMCIVAIIIPIVWVALSVMIAVLGGLLSFITVAY